MLWSEWKVKWPKPEKKVLCTHIVYGSFQLVGTLMKYQPACHWPPSSQYCVLIPLSLLCFIPAAAQLKKVHCKQNSYTSVFTASFRSAVKWNTLRHGVVFLSKVAFLVTQPELQQRKGGEYKWLSWVCWGHSHRDNIGWDWRLKLLDVSSQGRSRTVAKELLDLQSSEIVIPTFILFPG